MVFLFSYKKIEIHSWFSYFYIEITKYNIKVVVICLWIKVKILSILADFPIFKQKSRNIPVFIQKVKIMCKSTWIPYFYIKKLKYSVKVVGLVIFIQKVKIMCR